MYLLALRMNIPKIPQNKQNLNLFLAGNHAFTKVFVGSLHGISSTNSIFVQFRERRFPQLTRLPMGTNCAVLLSGLFFYSFEKEF